MDRRVVYILLVLGVIAVGYAAWSYFGRAGTVTGVFMPGGILYEFGVDAGEIYAGSAKTVNATTILYLPVDSNIMFYAVGTQGSFNYTIDVYDNGNYIGSFSNTMNLTTTMQQGNHTLVFTITIQAPTSITEPTPFTLEVYIVAQES